MNHGIAAFIVHCLVVFLYFVPTILRLTAEGQRLQVGVPLGKCIWDPIYQRIASVTPLPDSRARIFVICKRWA